MTQELLERLTETRPVSRPIAVMTGLWRRGHLRSPSGRDRRTDIRIPTDEPAIVSLPLPEGIERVEVRVLDVSRSGLRIALNRKLNQGAMVMVHLRDTDVMAEVRYTRPYGEQHHIGLHVRFVV